MITGVVWYVLIIAVPLALLWLAMRTPRTIGGMRDGWQARRRAREVRPQGPPIEKLAADLRRLRAERLYNPPTNNVRRKGLLMAYDSVLKQLCERLQIETALDSADSEFDLEVERLRTESAVQEAGVSLEVPRRYGRPASS